MDINRILAALNERASAYEFGQLQANRQQRLSLDKLPSRHPFPSSTTEEWAHHVGGRQELQFNVAEDCGDLRWGVAISLQTSRSFPDSTRMHPKVRKLSRAMEDYRSYLENRDFIMWYWRNHTPFENRSADLPIGPIPSDLYRQGVFLMLGKHASPNSFDASRVLRDFDDLLPVYEYVESDSDDNPPALSPPGTFTFVPDAQTDVANPLPETLATREASETEVSYRHRQIQTALKRELVEEGAQVGTEHADGNGRFVDLVACRNGQIEFYEIKTNPIPRLCVREAIGQLLEYAYWGGATGPALLCVVGSQPADSATNAYIEVLRSRFSIPICYRQTVIPTR